MAGNVARTTQELRNAAAALEGANRDLSEKMADIGEQLTSLESSWQSDSAKTICHSYRALDPKFKEYQRIVESYVHFLRQTADKYEKENQRR